MSCRPNSTRARRQGMTLVEMLIAMTITLIMMGLVAQLFAMMGGGIQGNRNKTELYNRMRTAAERLKLDLAGITAPLTPPLDPGLNLGYFEYIEGKESDWKTFGATRLGQYSLPNAFEKTNAAPTNGSDDRVVGDIDDVLSFTTRTADALFTGYHGGGVLESPTAEVVWYCKEAPGSVDPRTFNLYRRQRLVMAHPAQASGSGKLFSDTPNVERLASTPWASLLEMTDISCRIQNGYAIPNALGDLSKRENRFCRNPEFPHNFNPADAFLTFSGGRTGEDVILTNCIGFDVRYLNQSAGVRVVGDTAITLGDPGFEQSIGSVTLAPAFQDLDLPAGASEAVYDTWSTHYERNGIDDDGDGLVDEGTDGLDNDPNNGNNAIDEPAEAEAPPPARERIKGLEVRIRCIEPLTRKVLQITVRQSF